MAQGKEYWVYQFLFAKQDRANIDEAELKAFRLLAKTYRAMTNEQVDAQVADGHWIEICSGELEQPT